MRVGKIKACGKQPGSEKLYISRIDVGEKEWRTVVSGLQQHVSLDEMTSGLVIVFTNLKPRKQADVMSCGMILCATNEDQSKVELLHPSADAKIGERIQLDNGNNQKLSNEMQPQINQKVQKKLQDLLKTNIDCTACYNQMPLMTSQGKVMVSSLKDSQIC